MAERVCLIGLDEPEYSAIRERTTMRVIAHETLPRLMIKDGTLLVEAPGSFFFLPVSRVVFHGIFEDDFDFLAALALWGGPCLPNARALMNGRLRLPCLVRALEFTRLGRKGRGYVAPGVTFDAESESVAKWGNWHCGENKARFEGRWISDQPCLIEDFHRGQAVRVLLIGDHRWQIRLEGDGWLKSIHHAGAAFMEIDSELLDDAERIRRGFGTEILANDYIVSEDGSKHLLEVNLIPNVTRFPEVWEAYRDFVVRWIEAAAL
jgi:hypothetical protein